MVQCCPVQLPNALLFALSLQPISCICRLLRIPLPAMGEEGHVKCMFHVLAGMKSEFVAMAQAHWISCCYLNRTAGDTLRMDEGLYPPYYNSV